MRQFEGREKVFNFMTGRMMPVTVYYEYVPGRTGTYRAEVEEKINTVTVASIGNTYDEAVERLQRRLQSLAS
ncbi:MAG TPA: hypothetical protein VHP30_07110 [Ignavibacteriales bacterium]|nr:hypothetical protein [Ignavibacteriales bacterium]